MDSDQVAIKQKYLGRKGLTVLIIFLGAFIPLSTDLYLPALPDMAVSFNTSVTLMNLTILLFFIAFAAGSLLWGPLSDRYGRKRSLLIGLVLYCAASFSCAISGNLPMLIASRIVQAVGCGAVAPVSLAIIRDVYTGKKRESMLAFSQSFGSLAPIIAPVLGALMLQIASWHGMFWLLFLFGVIALIGALLMQETILSRNAGGVLTALSNMAKTLKNKSFTCLLPTFALITICLLAYVSSAPYIYQNQFGLSELDFSFYYSANGVFLLLGPLAFIALRRVFRVKTLLAVGYITMIVSGILVFLFGHSGPLYYLITLIPFTFMSGIMRPPTTNILLEQLPYSSTGFGASVMSFVNTVFISAGMLIISLDWADRVTVIGVMMALLTAASFSLWLLLSKKFNILPHEKTANSAKSADNQSLGI